MRPGPNMFLKPRRSLTPLHLKFNIKQRLTDQEFPAQAARVFILRGKCVMLLSGQNPEMCDAIGFHSSTTADYKNFLSNSKWI